MDPIWQVLLNPSSGAVVFLGWLLWRMWRNQHWDYDRWEWQQALFEARQAHEMAAREIARLAPRFTVQASEDHDTRPLGPL